MAIIRGGGVQVTRARTHMRVNSEAPCSYLGESPRRPHLKADGSAQNPARGGVRPLKK
jgi:hypothetical protein